MSPPRSYHARLAKLEAQLERRQAMETAYARAAEALRTAITLAKKRGDRDLARQLTESRAVLIKRGV